MKTVQAQIIQLNGLRGLAILFILVFHLFDYGFLSGVFYFGWCGVDLFFVISGFLITGILLDTKHQKSYFKTFWIRRVLRIFPLYYGVLFLFALISPHFPVTAWFTKYQLYFWTYTSNYLILKKGFFPPLGHFWSLALEEQFYIFWPFIVRVLKPIQLIAIACVLVLGGMVIRQSFTNEYLIFGFPFAHLDGLMFGAIAAVLIREEPERLFGLIDKLFWAALVILTIYTAGYLVIYGISKQAIFVRLPFSFTLVGLFFVCVLIISLKYQSLKDLLSKRVLLFFGKYSYGLYVFNSIFFYFSGWAGADQLDANHRLIINIAVLALTVITSYLSYNLFEIRFLRLKRKMPTTA